MTTDHTRDALATATATNAAIVHALLAIADAIDDGPYVPDAANRFLEKPVHLHTGEDDDTDSKLLTRFLEWLERERYIDKSRGWHLKGIADEYLATPPEARS